jgi:hypothetical protein
MHLDVVREAAVAAERGQTDRALDLLLDERLGEGWRDELPKPWLGAIRRAAANLGPLLAGTVTESVAAEAMRRVDVDTVLLVREDAAELACRTIEVLESLLPRARVETVAGTGSPAGSGPDWAMVIARVLAAPGA